MAQGQVSLGDANLTGTGTQQQADLAILYMIPTNVDLLHMVRWSQRHKRRFTMGSAVRVRSAGQKYGPTCHQSDRADVTEFVTLVRLSSLGQHVGVLALAGYKRRKSALTAGPIVPRCLSIWCV